MRRPDPVAVVAWLAVALLTVCVWSLVLGGAVAAVVDLVTP